MSTDDRRTRGRPAKYEPPEPIPDTPESVAKSLFRTRPKAERETLRKQGEEAAES